MKIVQICIKIIIVIGIFYSGSFQWIYKSTKQQTPTPPPPTNKKQKMIWFQNYDFGYLVA